jgi:hypothetical protein
MGVRVRQSALLLLLPLLAALSSFTQGGTSPATISAPYEISAQELYQRYAAHPVDTQKRIATRLVIVSGTVRTVAATGDGDALVILSADRLALASNVNTVRLRMLMSEWPEARGIHLLDDVRIECRHMENTPDGPSGSDCRFARPD